MELPGPQRVLDAVKEDMQMVDMTEEDTRDRMRCGQMVCSGDT